MICANCLHDRKKHCEKGTRHPFYKDEMRMVPDPRITVCVSDHCNVALCSCVQFVREA